MNNNINDTNINYLQSIPFIGWNKECSLSLIKSPDKLNFYFIEIDNIYHSADNIMTYHLIFFIGMLLMICIVAPLKAIKNDLVLYFYILLINTVFLFMCALVLLNSISMCWKLKFSKTEAMNLNNCSDPITNSYFNELQLNIYYIIYFYTLLFFCQILNWIVPLFVIMYYNMKSEDEEGLFDK
jgi:hypothetical protein